MPRRARKIDRIPEGGRRPYLRPKRLLPNLQAKSTVPRSEETSGRTVIAGTAFPLSTPSGNGPGSILSDDRIRRNEGRLDALVMPLLRREWLNLHLGGLHWVHNDLTGTNLKAIHSCLACRMFRDLHWPRPKPSDDDPSTP